MAKSRCEECERLIGISTRKEPIQVDTQGQPVGTSCWWYLDVHAHNGEICKGSGKKV